MGQDQQSSDFLRKSQALRKKYKDFVKRARSKTTYQMIRDETDLDKATASHLLNDKSDEQLDQPTARSSLIKILVMHGDIKSVDEANKFLDIVSLRH